MSFTASSPSGCRLLSSAVLLALRFFRSACWVAVLLPSWASCPLRVGAVRLLLLFGVFLMVSSFSLSLSGASSFSRAAVVVSSVRWCPSSSSVFVVSACGASFVCRVRGAARVPGRALWRALVAARDSGSPVVLGFFGSWSAASASCSFGSGAFWFDGVSVVASLASRFVCDALETSSSVVVVAAVVEPPSAARLATAWGVPVPAGVLMDMPGLSCSRVCDGDSCVC